MTDGGLEILLKRRSTTFLSQAWEQRDAPSSMRLNLCLFRWSGRKLRPALQAEGPVIVLDHYDNAASEGTMDTTEVLRAVLDAGLERVAVFGIFDPDVVEEMAAAGVGASVTVALGGKLPEMLCACRTKPAIDHHRRSETHLQRKISSSSRHGESD